MTAEFWVIRTKTNMIVENFPYICSDFSSSVCRRVELEYTKSDPPLVPGRKLV
jgi:hypothetical protein